MVDPERSLSRFDRPVGARSHRRQMVSAQLLNVTRTLAAAIISAIATVALAGVAVIQIRAGKKQTEIALQTARETREAAERQWQPRVFAHPWFWKIPGDREGIEGGAVIDGTLHAAYYLINQGSGPAFNVEHGIDVGGNRQKTGIILNMGGGHVIPPVFDVETRREWLRLWSRSPSRNSRARPSPTRHSSRICSVSASRS